jgi:hypothetical protein
MPPVSLEFDERSCVNESMSPREQAADLGICSQKFTKLRDRDIRAISNSPQLRSARLQKGGVMATWGATQYGLLTGGFVGLTAFGAYEMHKAQTKNAGILDSLVAGTGAMATIGTAVQWRKAYKKKTGHVATPENDGKNISLLEAYNSGKSTSTARPD